MNSLTSWSYRSCKSRFNTLPPPQSRLQRSVCYSYQPRPFRDGMGLVIERQQSIPPTVVVLHNPCSPSQVAFLVRKMIFNPVYAVARSRGVTDLCAKIAKRDVAGNAPATVIRKRFLLRIPTPLYDPPVDTQDFSSSFPVFCLSSTSSFGLETTTTFSRSNTTRQISRCDSAHFSAVTDAHPLPISPFVFANWGDSYQPPEPLGRNVSKKWWQSAPPLGVLMKCAATSEVLGFGLQTLAALFIVTEGESNL